MRKKRATLLLSLLMGIQVFAASQIKVICDRDGENIFLNGAFKSECNKDEVIRLLVKPGRYKIVIRKKDKNGRYEDVERFRIGDGVSKVIEVETKPVYSEYHYYREAIDSESAEACDNYLKRYPHGRYKKAVLDVKSYLDAKGDFQKYLQYAKKHPHGKYTEKLNRYYREHPLIATLRGQPSQVRAIAISRDDSRLYSVGYADPNLIEWDLRRYDLLKTMSAHWTGGVRGLNYLALSPDEKRAITAGGWGSRLWNLATGENHEIIKGSNWEKAAFLDGNRALWLDGGKFEVWRLDPKKRLYVYKKHGPYDADIHTFALSPDKKRLFFGEYDDRKKSDQIVVFDLSAYRTVAEWTHPYLQDSVYALALSPDGKYLVSGTSDGKNSMSHGKHDKTIIVWDVASGKPVQRLHQRGSIYAVAFNKKGGYFATGGETGEIKLWDLRSGVELGSFYASGMVNDLKFTHDGSRLIAALENKEIQVFYVEPYNHIDPSVSLLQGCEEGDMRLCNDYLQKYPNKKTKKAKEAIEERIAAAMGKSSASLFQDPKVMVLDRPSVKMDKGNNGRFVKEELSAIVVDGENLYVLIPMQFNDASFTFNSPIYLVQNGKKALYKARYPLQEKIGRDTDVVLVFRGISLQKGEVAVLEKDGQCPGCMRLDHSRIVGIR
ncbi:hypothetical protein [Hydrogenimonas sp. SS33]|uniref:WD40 repeat domain-containing protein n=1 Tax=Hydrogenimonas leucolamina TaxID=2954236 RepID=UPI00336BBF99